MKKNLIATAVVSVVLSSFVTYSLCNDTNRNLIDAQSAYNADVNGDGKVNVMDLNTLKAILFGRVSPEKPDEPDDAENDQLTILCWNANDSQPMADFFCKKTGTDPSKINIKNMDTFGMNAPEMYRQYLSDENNDADIIFLEPDWGFQFINDDKLTLPLSEIGYNDSDFSDIYSYIVETGKSTVTGDLKAISWQSAAAGYCYRTDLAEHYLGAKTPEEMQEKVADWDKFLETARELKYNNGPAISATLNGVLKAYSFSRTDSWFDENKKLKTDDFCIEFLDFAKNIWDNGYVTKVSQWSDEWKPLGQSDDIMGYFIPAWGFGDTILSGAAGGKYGATFGSWNVCPGPQEYYWGGTWMAPSTRIRNKALAKEFIDLFTVNKDTAEEYSLLYGDFMSNKKVVKSIINSEKYSGASVLGGQNQYEILDRVADSIELQGKISPYDAVIADKLISAANYYCEGVYTSYETIEDFVSGVYNAIIPVSSPDEGYDFGPDWRSLYEPEIKKAASEKEGDRYEFYDVNGDFIPELFISHYDYHPSEVSIYTISDNKVCHVADKGSFGKVYFCPDNQVLISSYVGMGMEFMECFTIEEGKEKVIADFQCNEGAVSDEADVYYLLNQTKVSKEEYYEEHNKYSNKIALGRDVPLN